jgi:hypothetical protein
MHTFFDAAKRRCQALPMRARWSVLGLLALVGCGTPPRAPVPLPEAGPRPDGGPRADANALLPTAPPTIDGTLDERAWRSAALAEGSILSDGSGRALRTLRALVMRERLYVAVEGALAAGDRLLVYVDGARGDELGVADLSTLGATEGPLDSALAQPFALASGVRPELGWGTTAMPYAAMGLDPSAGWRELDASPPSVRRLDAAVAPVACSLEACEASLALSRLGGARPRRIAIFARVVSADGALTGVTLPADDAARPEVVSAVLEVEDGAAASDAGVGPRTDGATANDGGGPAGIVVDGVIDASEWDGVASFANTISTDGTPFEGSALLSLRAVQDGVRLYVAIEGSIHESEAILMYVDREVEGADGLVLTTATIGDPLGALDLALGKDIRLPGDLRVDFAWATLDLGRAAEPDDARMGWRDLLGSPVDLRAIATERAPTVCSERACETSISLEDLGARASSPMGLFVRLGSAELDVLSNQTLPLDLAGTPEVVTTYLRLDPP